MKKDLLTKGATSPMTRAMRLVELEALKKQIVEEIAEHKAYLLETTKELDVISLKTGSYTITRAKRITPQVVDFKALKQALEEANIPYVLEEVFAEQMNEVFKQAVKEDRQLDGLEARETEYITVRIKEDKNGDR